MLNRRLLEVLSRLSPEQHKKLRLFLQSPYFNGSVRSDNLLRLYDYIVTCNASEKEERLDKKVVFLFLFPGQDFSEHQKTPLDSLTSELHALTKRFLGQQKMEQARETEGLALLEFYRKFGLEERFRQTAENLKAEIEANPYRDANYYRQKYLLDMEVATFSTMTNSFQDDANLISYNQNLDLAYSIGKMEINCLLKMQKVLASFEDSSTAALFSLVADLSKPDKPLCTPLNTLYNLIAELIDDPSDAEKFQAFDALVHQNQHLIPTNIFNGQMMAYYRYFVARQALQSTDKDERVKMYELYKSHYQKGYFFIDGLITNNYLLALVQMAGWHNDTAWAQEMLHTHTADKILGTRFPEEAYNLLWADYAFSQKDYTTALQKIEMRLFENPTYSIRADIVIIKIYFEEENDLLEYRMKALEQKVRRTKMSAFMKERYLNFLKKLDKINKYSTISSKEKRNKILEGIKNEKNIYERDWLIAKLTK